MMYSDREWFRIVSALEQANELCWKLYSKLNKADLLFDEDSDIRETIRQSDSLVDWAKRGKDT